MTTQLRAFLPSFLHEEVAEDVPHCYSFCAQTGLILSDPEPYTDARPEITILPMRSEVNRADDLAIERHLRNLRQEKLFPEVAGYCYTRFYPCHERRGAIHDLGAYPTLYDFLCHLYKSRFSGSFLSFISSIILNPELYSLLHLGFPASCIPYQKPGVLLNIRIGSAAKNLKLFSGTMHGDPILLKFLDPVLKQFQAEQKEGLMIMDECLKELLRGEGVAVSDLSTISSAHGAHKSMEIHLYEGPWNKMISEDSVAIFFVKEHKYQHLSRDNPKYTSYHNVTLDTKDFSRFGECTLPNQLTEKAILLWDVGQFLNTSVLASLFIKYPTVRRIYIGAVIPVEASRGLSSLYPAYYTINYLPNGSIIYEMEGTSQGNYEQPANNDWFFETSVVRATVGPHQVQFHMSPLDSHLSHHLAVADRVIPAVDRETWKVTYPDVMRIPQPWLTQFDPSQLRGEQLVPRSLYMELLLFTTTKSGPGARDIKDLRLKIRNTAAAKRYAYIRPETWAMLCLSVHSVATVAMSAPSVNTLEQGYFHSMLQSIVATAQAQKMPNKWRFALDVLRTILRLFVPAWLVNLDKCFSFVEEVYNIEDFIGGCKFTGKILLSLILPPWASVLLRVANLGWVATCFYVQNASANTRAILESVYQASEDFIFTRKPVEVRAQFAEIPFLAKPLPPGETLNSFPRCPSCGRLGYQTTCPTCRTCTVHNLLQPQPQHVEEFPCCVAAREQLLADQEAERVRLQQVEAERMEVVQREMQLRMEEAATIRANAPGATQTAEQQRTTPRVEVTTEVEEEAEEEWWNDEAPPADGQPESSNQHLTNKFEHPMNKDPHRVICPPTCPDHGFQGPGEAPFGMSWTSCVNGHGHWAKTTLLATTCHLCPEHEPTITMTQGVVVRSLGKTYISRRMNFLNADVVDPENPHWIVANEPARPVPYPGTCMIAAFSKALSISEENIWRTLLCFASQDTVEHVDLGLDERAAHTLGLAYNRRITFVGNKPGAPTRGGSNKGAQLTLVYSHNGKEGHWELGKNKTVKLLDLGESVAKTNDSNARQFIKRLDVFVSSHGEKVLGRWEEYTTDKRMSKQLCSELKNGIFGLAKQLQGKLFVEGFVDRLDICHDVAEERTVSIRKISGLAGCGKSDPIKQFLKKNKRFANSATYYIALPRALMHADWKNDLDLRGANFLINTLEKIFARTAAVLIIDELSLFPPGFVDLLLMVKPETTHVLLLGDSCQSRFNNPNRDSKLNERQNEAERLLAGTDFLMYTHRSPQIIAERLGITTTSPVIGQVIRTTVPDHRYPVIVATDGEVTAYSSLGHKVRSVSGHQGATYHTATLMISKATLLAQSDDDLYAAASRVTHRLYVCIASGNGMSRLINSRNFVLALLGLTPPTPFEQRFAHRLGGYNLIWKTNAEVADIRRKRIAATAQLSRGKTYLQRAPVELSLLLQQEQEGTVSAPKQIPDFELDLKVPTSLPRADPVQIIDAFMAGLSSEHEREFRTDLGKSNAFKEAGPEELGHNVHALFPKQTANDPVLREITIAKRLRHRSAEQNREELVNTAFQGQLLLQAFFTITGTDTEPQEFDPVLFKDCIYENEFVKLTKKTEAVLRNNVNRSDPNWKLQFVEHFIKTQLKGKMAAVGIDVKAGQTIATCHDAVVILFGPMVRYLRRKLLWKLPENIYCNCGRPNSDLNAWAKNNWKDVESTISDYEAFDSTQVGDCVNFELGLLQHFGLSEAYINCFEDFRHLANSLPELYAFWKTHIISDQIGEKATGRDTGEPGTFDFNTYVNLALIQLMYEPELGCVIAVGGDDMAANCRLVTSKFWRKFSYLFHIKAKVEYTLRPDFCAFFLTSRGAYKDPIIIALKTLYHKSLGDLHAVDFNYAAEIKTAYEFGDEVYTYLSWQQLEALGFLIRHYHSYPWAYLFFSHVDPEEKRAVFEKLYPGLKHEVEFMGRKTRQKLEREIALRLHLKPLSC